MADQTDPRLFDVRVIEQRIRQGLVTPEEYKAWLDSLPDEAEESAETNVRFNPSWAGRKKKAEG